MTLRIFDDDALASRAAAELVLASNDRARASNRRPVLGLAAGRTPIALYGELADRHRQGATFADVEVFGLDEYQPIQATHPASFHRFFHAHLFDHVDLRSRQRHVLEGWLPAEHLAEHCAQYEQRIRDAGGIDLLILGIGENGHLGFNEPGSPRASRTRRVTLSAHTRRRNADAFASLDEVPRHGLTMGLATIREARSLLLLVFGAAKADILKAALLGPATDDVPASLLRDHPDLTVFADAEAARQVHDR